ncbi:hypothetical protein ZWY2020_029070 [Hordeum vulgare]|nr:hypothetical protein ZWY2020_029070 [Hordeum vulgare]
MASRCTAKLPHPPWRAIACAVSFRPCIVIHKGKLKQIVGSTLRDASDDGTTLVTNFESGKSPAECANIYKEDGLVGGHVIMLGGDPASCSTALEALHAYPGGLHVGGGINLENAVSYLNEGASHVIITSIRLVGKQRLILDLSCRKKTCSRIRYVCIADPWLCIFVLEWCIRLTSVNSKSAKGLFGPILLGQHLPPDYKYVPISLRYSSGVSELQDLMVIGMNT